MWTVAATGFGVFGERSGRRIAATGMVANGATPALATSSPGDSPDLAGLRVPSPRPIVSIDAIIPLPLPPHGRGGGILWSRGHEVQVLWLPLNTLAAAVGFYCTHTGMHHTGDVIAGWILGKMVAPLVGKAADRLLARRAEQSQYSSAAGSCPSAMAASNAS